MTKSPRFTLNDEVWICPSCGLANIHGRKCRCGKCQADALTAKYKAVVSEVVQKASKPRKKSKPLRSVNPSGIYFSSCFVPVGEKAKYTNGKEDE